jgi:hypothetical protein
MLMGRAVLRKCQCGSLVNTGEPCPTCKEQKAKAYDAIRGTRSARGYDRTWEQWRAATLRQYGLRLCGDRPPHAPATGDSVCQATGYTQIGDDLDHIIPITGLHDTRRLDASNVQFLCDRAPNFCHSRKRQRESMRRPTR